MKVREVVTYKNYFDDFSKLKIKKSETKSSKC